MIIKNDNKFYLNYTLFNCKNIKQIKNNKYVSETFSVNTRLLSSHVLPKTHLTDIEVTKKSIENKSNFKSYLGKNNTLTQVLFKNNKNKYLNSVIDTNARVSIQYSPEN
jgi:hypothetical protein